MSATTVIPKSDICLKPITVVTVGSCTTSSCFYDAPSRPVAERRIRIAQPGRPTSPSREHCCWPSSPFTRSRCFGQIRMDGRTVQIRSLANNKQRESDVHRYRNILLSTHVRPPGSHGPYDYVDDFM